MKYITSKLIDTFEITKYYLSYSHSTRLCKVFKLLTPRLPSLEGKDWDYYTVLCYSNYFILEIDNELISSHHAQGNMQFFGVSEAIAIYQLSEDEVSNWLLPNII